MAAMAAHEIGLFPLPAVLVPGELMPLHIFEERYKDLVGSCLESDGVFAILFADDDGARELGCTARIVDVLERYDDGRLDIMIRGVEVVRVLELTRGRSYLTARVEAAPDDPEEGDRADAVLELLRRAATASGAPDAVVEDVERPLSYAVTARIELPPRAKQRILELRSESARLGALEDVLNEALGGLELVEEIRRRAQSNGHVSRRPG
jgi:Lon protease-like protein